MKLEILKYVPLYPHVILFCFYESITVMPILRYYIALTFPEIYMGAECLQKHVLDLSVAIFPNYTS